jgi:hypothetical protein
MLMVPLFTVAVSPVPGTPEGDQFPGVNQSEETAPVQEKSAASAVGANTTRPAASISVASTRAMWRVVLMERVMESSDLGASG